MELDIWGWADPGTWVTVRLNGGYYETQTGDDGRWMVTLPPQKAGGPYIMEVNEKVILVVAKEMTISRQVRIRMGRTA